MWEIFDPRNGTPLKEVRFRFVARVLCWFIPSLDYERKGKGWV